jgi:hypothetical protein
MSANSLSCPFCNALQPIGSDLIVGQRIACVRCGETFTLSHVPSTAIQSPSGITTRPASQAEPSRKPVRANRLVGALLLLGMLMMAGIGLAFALQTTQKRRDHDRALPRKSRRPWLTDRTPSVEESPAAGDLAGLRYLPPGTGLVVALHVEELLASPAGKEATKNTWKIGNSEFSLASLRDWTGLSVEEIEHVVLGVVVRGGEDADLTPATHLIIRTRQRYDQTQLRQTLKATRSREEKTTEGGKRTLYSATVRNLPVQLWLANETTIVMGLFSNMEQVPGKPHDGLTHLPPDLRQVIEKRLPSGVSAWVAGHAADWKKTWLPALLGQQKDLPLVSRLAQVRTFALWLAATKPARFAGTFGCVDEASAIKIEQADLAPRQKANPEAFKFSREDAWLDVQWTLPTEK